MEQTYHDNSNFRETTTMFRKALTTAVLGSLMAAGSASAATLSYSFTHPQAPTEINQTGSLGLFDSALGTLTGVTLALSGESTATISLSNRAAETQTTRATAFVEMYFSSAFAALNALFASPMISLSATTGFQTLAAGQTASFGPLTDSDTANVAGLAGILSSFSVAGGGNFGIACESLTGLAIQGGGGNIATSLATTAACGATIAYEYTARTTNRTPEPETLALLGLCVVGAGVARRKFAA